MNKNVGKIIKNKRKKLKLTQEDLAKKLNVTASTISNWETNSNFPEKDLVPKICEVLKIKEEKLYKNYEICTLEEMRKKDKNIIGIIKFVVLFLITFVLLSSICTLCVNSFGMSSHIKTANTVGKLKNFIKIEDKVKKRADENLNKIKNSNSSNFTEKEKEQLVKDLEKMSRNCELLKTYDLNSKNNYEISIKSYKVIKMLEDIPSFHILFKKDNRILEEKYSEKAFELWKKSVIAQLSLQESFFDVIIVNYQYPSPNNYYAVVATELAYKMLEFSYGEYYLALTEYVMKVGGISD